MFLEDFRSSHEISSGDSSYMRNVKVRKNSAFPSLPLLEALAMNAPLAEAVLFLLQPSPFFYC